MGLEELKQELMDDARRQCDEIISGAKINISQLEKEYGVKMQAVREKFDADIKKQVDEMKRRQISSAELEGKNSLFKVKKEAIETLFSEVKKKISEMPKEDKKKMLKNLLNKAKNELEVNLIFCSKSDKEAIMEIVGREFKELSENVDIREEKMLGGIIVENSDGTVRIDLSYESVIESFREKNLEEIGKILFE